MGLIVPISHANLRITNYRVKYCCIIQYEATQKTCCFESRICTSFIGCMSRYEEIKQPTVVADIACA